jgi:hypothetical protein
MVYAVRSSGAYEYRGRCYIMFGARDSAKLRVVYAVKYKLMELQNQPM